MIWALVTMLAMPMFAERVTPETARKVASTFLNNNGTKASQLTDLTKEAGFTNLYIFAAEQGFVVMSADDCVQPILGYSLTDMFDTKDMPENLKWWLQGYSDEIQSAIDNKMRASSEVTKMWKDLAEGNSKAGKATMVVAPLIQTKWNQNKYYNDLCPAVSDGPNGHAYTGCVATAMAQIMKYWSYPSTGIGSHSYTWNGQTLNADFGATTYDWANMEDYYEYYFVNGTDQYAHWLSEPSAEKIAAVATLMYHCGVSVDMIYGGNSTGGSAAPNAYVANALKTYFNYKNTAQYKQKSYNSTVYYTDEEWIAMLKAELNANRPMQYGGQDPNGNSGHAFVCDGYNTDDYFHFNWGWAGRYNGYFSINNLDTGANSGEAGAGNGVYTRNQDAVIGIEPGSMVPAPTNLTYTLSGLNDITLTWNGVSAASSYNVYRNGNLIGNTTETTYSENAPFGELSYYVRCVDANSQLSLSSNTVTVTIAYQTPIVTDLTATLSGNNVNLTWTTPEWCYPETPSATLTYGDGSMNGIRSNLYWAHRYLSDNLSQYANKAIYKISFYAYETGSYTCYIYKGATEESYQGDIIFWPSTLMTSKTVEVTSTSEWIDIDLDELVTIDGQDDIWVIMNDPNNGNGRYSATYSSNPGDNNHGGYWGKWTSGEERGYVLNNERAYLIRTYLTDGTYTYNLYDGTTTVASNISNTSYTVNNITNNVAHQYTVKTNFNGNETAASNMVGFSLGNASINNLSLAANDQMTITEGSKLTVSGTLSDLNADNLILEDGAQLINNSEGVKATVKKAIQPYTDGKNDGWNLIASPITENLDVADDVNGLVRGDYDLYIFDQAGNDGKEWRNYEEQAFTTIDNKVGYLYSNSNETMISFAGTLAGTAESTTITRDNTIEFPGFNLIGNPYPCEVYTSKPFYTVQYDAVEDKTYFDVGNNPIPPCSAILVQAQTAEESVSFSKTPIANQASITMKLSKSNIRSAHHIDQVRISFEADYKLSKYTWDDASSTIYIPQNGQNFAVAYADGASEMPINIHVVQNGTYTISFEEINLNLNYLHLIDNLTGNEVDLFATPNYTFEAKTTDYASRFKLVFSICEDADGGNDSFAFVSNGQLHILNNGEAQLQIVDIMGRILSTETIHGSWSKALNLNEGIYIVRLIQSSETKTQKVVVR